MYGDPTFRNVFVVHPVERAIATTSPHISKQAGASLASKHLLKK